MKRLMLFLIVFLAINGVHSQEIEISKATVMHWSGGACCRQGVNYVIELELKDTPSLITIDTVWIGKEAFTVNSGRTFYTYQNVNNGKLNYQIEISQSWDNMKLDTDNFINDNLDISPPEYKGEACVIFYYGKRKMSISVDKFTNIPSPPYP